MHCLKCSTNIPDGLHVCTQCGFEIGSPEDTLVIADGAENGGPQESLLDVVRRELSRDYEVEAELARGGMAVVYRATEVELTRQVALKVLPPEMALSQSMANRFKREARMAASLEHPNIIPIYRVGQAGRLFFITMKYIEGRPLSAIIEAQGPLPAPVAWHVLRGCVSALAHAHEHGIIHRDIKGANILVDVEGKVIVSDFGVARALEDASMTASGSVIGTPYFMSPEQCAGKTVGPQTDQYSLGVLGFQMLAGHVPYDAETIAAVMHHHFFTPIPQLGAVRPDVPQQMIDVINRALAKNPKQRYGTTQEMLEAIEAVPVSDADRRWGEAMLRELAAGVAIPRIEAGELPKLPDVAQLSGPYAVQQPVFTPSEADLAAAAIGVGPRRRRRTAAMLAAAGLTGVAGTTALWMTLQGSTPATGQQIDSAAIAATVLAAAESTSRAPDPPPRPVVGVVRVSGAPAGARVSVGGRRIGRGMGEVPPGNHDWEIDADGYFPRSGTISVSAGDTVLLDGRLEARPQGPPPTGLVRISAVPRSSAVILVDDRTLGVGIVFDSVLTVGTHRLRVTAPGYEPFDTTFTIQEGVTTTLPRIQLRDTGGTP